MDGIPVNPGGRRVGEPGYIWRHIWAPFQPVFRVLVAPVLPDDGPGLRVIRRGGGAASRTRRDGLPLYLAPYWVPTRGPRAAFSTSAARRFWRGVRARAFAGT